MKAQEFVEKLTTLGYSERDAAEVVWVAEDLTGLRLRCFNVVPLGNDQYEVLRSDERDSFYRMIDSEGGDFKGTLEEAYGFIFDSLQKHYEMYKGWKSS
ncbi:MAG: hypothetical protein LCH36_02725 [Actinobacteria bacterium]|jgi:hypothetical protein|nr:hypothetical protein [Actinomycetota bacterium]